MWIWLECEDFSSSDGGARIVDDWGAAAHRCVQMASSSSVSYDFESENGRDWTLTLRYRLRSASPARVRVRFGEFQSHIDLQPTDWRYGWASIPFDASAGSACIMLSLPDEGANCDLDGFFIHDEPVELPGDVRQLDPVLGEIEAELAAQGYWREISIPDSLAPSYNPDTRFASDVAREAAGDVWPVLESMAQKPCPYIINAYDIGKGTDYNADYSWHTLDKEKRWELPWSGALGIVNPNSDLSYVLGFAFNTDPVSYDWRFRPVLHLANAAIYDVDLDPSLRTEVMFRCHDSNTVGVTVHIANLGDEEKRVVVGELMSKDHLENPPFQRYTLPGQMFGAGVSTTAGGLAWTGVELEGKAVAACFHEWIRGRSRGRRLLAMSAAAQLGEQYQLDPAREEDVPTPAGGVMAVKHAVVVPAGKTAVVTLALNMHRFTTFDTWAPELTPKLYIGESEEAAEELAYMSCADAISADVGDFIRRSIEPYRAFPKVTLPDKTWEADFYCCIELPRASTFSPLGNIKTPFYNFCRVHAHEPFGWWSYGMHAHEDLCTLFTNITDPDLSASFLRGHIRHQREDGKYPYGVSHTISPRLTTDEATAPLIAWEAWQSYLWSGDREFLVEAYESGRKNQEWWLSNRDRCGEGLCHWLDTCNESVRDDGGLTTWVVTGGSQYQEALDLNCYILVQEQTLAEMARELGLDEQAKSHEEKAGLISKVINAYMWHSEGGCYYGTGEVVPSWADVKDISTFFPLWAKLAPSGRFEGLARLIDDPETFGTPYGPPTLAKNEPCFGAQRHWYGSNWVEMSMFPIFGLRNYGYYKRAADLAYQNTRMVFDELEKYGHFREYFNSIEGNGTDLIDYIWTAMPGYFVVGIFFGVELSAAGISILPSLPTGWDRAKIENLTIRGKRLSISVKTDPQSQVTAAGINGVSAEVVGNRGAFISWVDLADGTAVEIIQPATLGDEPAAPAGAPTDWSDIPPHQYPDDPKLVEEVRSRMKRKDECG